MKALITTMPFGDKSRLPLKLLEEAGVEYLINPYGKKMVEDELVEMITDFDVIIAGTEPITDRVMEKATKLQLISRVGVGLDSVDLIAAKRRNIKVSYTPDAPVPAVAELTFGMMLILLRSMHISNSQMHRGKWKRIFGRRLAEVIVGVIGVIGVIGVGRIGTQVLDHVSNINKSKILVNDINPKYDLNKELDIEWVTKEQIYQEADIICMHVPMTKITKNMIRREQLMSMRDDAIIINTSRGGIINEKDLYDVMTEGHLSGAAIDVFENEPYTGKLAEIERCLLTAHMGSMSVDCRTRMELEATEETVRFFNGQQLESEVPEYEYENQK